MFPTTRPRRLRRSPALRELVRETRVHPGDLVYPLFVRSGKGVRTEIGAMPGQFHFSVDTLVEEVGAAIGDGVRSVLLFGIPDRKDEQGSEAWAEGAAVQTAVRHLKKAYADLIVMTDVCLCEYTSHGHCGLVKDGRVQNDPTLPLLAKAALSHVQAGADIVAPSDMMDGRVGAIREAAGSAPQFGDRRAYQMDPGNGDEALREVALDLEEGADLVMVKPALPYLNVVRRVKDAFGVPVAAYNVSGEYSMLLAAAAHGWIERERAILETLTSIKRAGASIILTYHAREAARLLR